MNLKNVYVGDTETSTGNEDGSTNVYLGGISSLDKKTRYIGLDVASMFASIYEHKLAIIYFHNLTWDGEFFIYGMLDNHFTFINDKFKKPKKQNAFTYMRNNMGSIYDLKVNYRGFIISFKCSYKLIPISVGQLGEALNYPKGVIDYDKYKKFNSLDEVPELVQEYLWRDIEIVIDSYVKFKEVYRTHGITPGSTALKSFKNLFSEYEYIRKFGGKCFRFGNKANKFDPYVRNVLTVAEWDEFKRGYRGGLTIYNKNYYNKELALKGESVDINSLYPWVMGNKLLPVGKPHQYKLHEGMLEYHKIFVKRAVIKDSHIPAYIPNNYSTKIYECKYLDKVEKEYYNLWSWELDVGKQGYEMDYRVVKTWYFECQYVFKNGISIMKLLKMNASNENERIYHKLVQNSLYGKQGQNRIMRYRTIKHDPEKQQLGIRYGKNEEYVEYVETEEAEVLSYIPSASAITAYARTFLLENVLRNTPNVIYCDTDSMYVIGEAQVEKGDHEYGKGKNEVKFDRIKVLKPKAYLLQQTHVGKKGKWVADNTIKRAIGGLNKANHAQVNFSNFKRGEVLQDGQRQKHRVKGGVILKSMIYTL